MADTNLRLYRDSLVIIFWCRNKVVVLQLAMNQMAWFEKSPWDYESHPMKHLFFSHESHVLEESSSASTREVTSGLESYEGSLLVPLTRGAG